MLNIKQIFDMEDCDKSHEIAQLMSKLEKVSSLRVKMDGFHQKM